ncbi:hypothetical protein V3589_14970 [Sinorhizobium fredii]|uniref:hypothetical protein n=1 Tax=Rhizobium fredii TaxID=380 RepID=UPI0030ABB986
MKGAERQRWLAQMRFWRSLDAQFDRFAAEYQKNRSRYQRVAKARKPPRPVRDTEWREPMQYDEIGLPIANQYNAVLCMSECPELSGLVGYDLRTHQTMLKGPLPGEWRLGQPDFEMRPFSRDDLTALHVFVQGIGFPRMRRDTLFWAVRNAARQNEWRSEP